MKRSNRPIVIKLDWTVRHFGKDGIPFIGYSNNKRGISHSMPIFNQIIRNRFDFTERYD
jgi:hypothetical protein